MKWKIFVVFFLHKNYKRNCNFLNFFFTSPLKIKLKPETTIIDSINGGYVCTHVTRALIFFWAEKTTLYNLLITFATNYHFNLGVTMNSIFKSNQLISIKTLEWVSYSALEIKYWKGEKAKSGDYSILRRVQCLWL